MKKQLTKETFWKSLLSITVLGFFIVLATGSLEFLKDKKEYLGNGVYKTTEYYGEDEREVTTGKQDDKGRWHGMISRDVHGSSLNSFTEEVNMVNGLRHGKSKISGYRIFTGTYVYYTCYNMGKRVDCEESSNKSTAGTSSYQVLSNKYPWYLYTLNNFDFEDKYVEAYMDTIEKILNTNTFDDTEFDDYYGNVTADLQKTTYDSIIAFNSLYSIFKGLEEIKNSDLRLAVIDRYRKNNKSTFNMVKSVYPNYLLSLKEKGITDQAFESFCFSFDSCMSTYGTLNVGDPFFIDSVDTRMFRAMETILSVDDSSLTTLNSLKTTPIANLDKELSSARKRLKSSFEKTLINSDAKVVAQLISSNLLVDFAQGDKIKQAVREAYLNNKGVVFQPTVTTEFLANTSATGVSLKGYVIEDGGAPVTSRGVVWATFYNPTINDNIINSGTGTGSYTVNLTGLTEGLTYYARAYATNSTGTAYGNCISYVAQLSSGINEESLFATDFSIYPNPNSSVTLLNLNVESPENIFLTIIDMKGQEVFFRDLGNLPIGKKQLELDLSGLQDGMYTCQLSTISGAKIVQKLVISH